MKYFYTILCIGLILIIWFAPIDLEREKQLANTGPRILVMYLLESTSLKIVFTVILGFIMIGVHRQNNSEKE